MKKLSFLLAILLLFPLTQAISQQITKFAVIDTSRIYTTFSRDSRSVRDYEAKKTRYQSDIKRMSDEIKQLRQQKVDAEAASDTSRATRLERDIEKKTSFLVEYSKAKNAELDTLKERLVSDDDFYSLLYEEIRLVAESDGYSMVLSLHDNSSIMWYSPTVDITDKIIRNMTSRR